MLLPAASYHEVNDLKPGTNYSIKVVPISPTGTKGQPAVRYCHTGNGFFMPKGQFFHAKDKLTWHVNLSSHHLIAHEQHLLPVRVNKVEYILSVGSLGDGYLVRLLSLECPWQFSPFQMITLRKPLICFKRM